jgi:patatin-like phospholipase/acyl hydrolase
MAKLFRILSIDGGGIRGVLPGEILVELERLLQLKSGNSSARIADHFDLVAGTSTGGILTCLYICPDVKQPSRPRFTAREAVNLYLLHGNRIFRDVVRTHQRGATQQEKYPAAPLESVFQEYFDDLRLSQMLRPCLVTSYNILKRSTHFFTSHDAQNDPGCDYYVREVARATTAAPTYFEPARVTAMDGKTYPLIDGGVFANNPALCAFAEAEQILAKAADHPVSAKHIFMLSIGTASMRRGYDYHPGQGWGKQGFVPPVLDVLMSGAGDTVDFQAAKVFEAAGAAENYVRINPGIGKADGAMDNGSERNLKALHEAGQESASRHSETLDRVAEILLKG